MDHPTGLYRGKYADDNYLKDHPTNPHRGKNADSNGLTDHLLLVDCVTIILKTIPLTLHPSFTC